MREARLRSRPVKAAKTRTAAQQDGGGEVQTRRVARAAAVTRVLGSGRERRQQARERPRPPSRGVSGGGVTTTFSTRRSSSTAPAPAPAPRHKNRALFLRREGKKRGGRRALAGPASARSALRCGAMAARVRARSPRLLYAMPQEGARAAPLRAHPAREGGCAQGVDHFDLASRRLAS